MLALLQLLIPVIIGLLLGLIGGGGSVLTVPYLIYVLGQGTKEAFATSLFAVGVAALVGALYHASKSNLVLLKSVFFGFWGMLASYLSARFLVPLLSDELQIKIFAILVLLIAILMLFKKQNSMNNVVDSHSSNLVFNFVAVFFSGIFVGTITGIVGVGGGFLIVPALHYFLKMPINKAIGSSLLIIAMQAFSGFLAYQKEIHLNISFIFYFSSLVTLGSLLGSFASSRIKTSILQKIFAVTLLIIGLFMLLS
ncbi:MAG: sulfite exporter TauE/SafE family protein [Candidatus Melainabacteria bacterium]|nr:sulfite exporter TauE/SafE family protein [Candidatus Melainabacteria bacterium]